MNISALSKGFTDRFERNAAFDFYVFYPEYVTRYDYKRTNDGHIADTTGVLLSHSEIRTFVRRVMSDQELYNSISSAYVSKLPSNKVYEDSSERKLVVRHLRGDWTTASSMREINVYFKNPLFGSTTADLAHNFYMAWVGGYQRNRIYYGDLIVPVARERTGPFVRNESILPVQIVRGVTTPNAMNCTGMLLEDWLEYRAEFSSDEWSVVDVSIGTLDDDGRFVIIEEDDYGKYRIIYSDSSGEEQVVYFKSGSDEATIISADIISEPNLANLVLEQYGVCTEVSNMDEY